MLFNPTFRIGINLSISFQSFLFLNAELGFTFMWSRCSSQQQPVLQITFFSSVSLLEQQRSSHHTHSCGSFQIFARIFLIESCGRSNSEGGKEMRCVTTDRIECQATCESDKKLFEVRDMHCTLKLGSIFVT